MSTLSIQIAARDAKATKKKASKTKAKKEETK